MINAACQDLKDELDRVDASIKAERRKLQRAKPEDKPGIAAELNSLLQDENLVGLVLLECQQRNPTLSFVSVEPSRGIIPLGTVQEFSAVAHFSNGTTKMLTDVVWTSSDPAVASMSSASGSPVRAKGVIQGTVTITAAAPGLAISPATLVVGLASIAVTPAQATIGFPGGVGSDTNIVTFAAIGTFADGSIGIVTTSVNWRIDHPKVAHISNAAGSQGRTIGTEFGTAFIRATTTNASGAGANISGIANLTVA